MHSANEVQQGIEPREPYRHFTPWVGNDGRSCRTCAHAIGYDGAHLWCRHFRLVVVQPCGLWQREAGCD